MIAGIIYPFAGSLVAFFNARPEVVAYGTRFLYWMSPFYVFCCFNQVYGAALRGAGHSRATMIIMLAAFVAFRQVYLFTMANFISNTVIPIAMSYPAGWILCTTCTLIYFNRADLSKYVVVKQ
jgi:Na+-driven multidrug efflux pump